MGVLSAARGLDMSLEFQLDALESVLEFHWKALETQQNSHGHAPGIPLDMSSGVLDCPV